MFSINQTIHGLPFLVMLMLYLSTLALGTRPTAITSSGKIEGIQDNTPTGTVNKFLGIPYAQPPVGDLRFNPPQPLDDEAAKSIVDAGQFKASCMQSDHMGDFIYPQLRGEKESMFFDEDCLFLNVFVPVRNDNAEAEENDIDKLEKDANKPIMIWLPGEGYNFASSTEYDMSALATEGNVIVVTVNYRVSLFGFLSTGDEEIPGNMGLLDQLAAINWVKKNSDAFGGDSDRITVFGRLTGSTSVSALLVSPLSMQNGNPLFHRAIMQSGIAGESWIIDRNPADGFKHAAEMTGCWSTDSSTHKIVECLRKVPAKHLLDVANYIHNWRLVLNKETLPDEPLNVINQGKHASIPVMAGATNDDGSICLLTHFFMNRTLYDRIINDEITKDEFRKLARDFLLTYVGKAEDDVVDKIVERYGMSEDNSWRSRYIKLCGDGYFCFKTEAIAKELSERGSHVFLYQFSHRPSQSFHEEFLEASHGDDILFSLGLVQQGSNWTPEEIELSKIMTNAWTNFAKSGDPNPVLGSDEEWPSYSADSEKYWDFSLDKDSGVKTISSTWSHYQLWQEIVDTLNKSSK